jgi:hypothetical protein
MSPNTTYFVFWGSVIGLLLLWSSGWQILGRLFHAILFFSWGHLAWTPEKDKQPFLKSFSIHVQEDSCFGPHWGIGFHHGGRRHFYFHEYMGWHDLSEGHRRNKCDDPAYCPWHGSL